MWGEVQFGTMAMDLYMQTINQKNGALKLKILLSGKVR